MVRKQFASRIENAVAAAAAASFRLLRPVRLEDDLIAAQLAWRHDVEELDASIGARLPGLDSLRRAADHYDLRALWRYRFVELAAVPSKTDCDGLLAALAQSIVDRDAESLSGGLPTLGVGPFLIGPLGVIELPRMAWTGVKEICRGTWHRWQIETTPSAIEDCESTCAGSVDRWRSFESSGWSDAWMDWFQMESGISVHPWDEKGERTDVDTLWLWQEDRDGWSPDSMVLRPEFEHYAGELYEVTISPKPFGKLLELLEACIGAGRREFFDAVDYRFAPKAGHAVRDRDVRAQLGPGELWQLLHIAQPRTVFALVRERGLVSPLRDERSFAERLAQALIEARDLSGDSSLLDQFVHAEGTEYDRVLHRVLRSERPYGLVKNLVAANAKVTLQLAQITAAPLRFQGDQPDSWDRTCEEEQEAVCRSIASALGFVETPLLDPSVLPLQPMGSCAERDRLQDAVTRGRRRSEWILRLMCDYLARLQRKEWPSELWTSPKLCDWAREQTPAIDCQRPTLAQIAAVHSYLCGLVKGDAPRYLKEIRDSQQSVTKQFGCLEVSKSGNLGAHHNQVGASALAAAYESLYRFDLCARDTQDALPDFVRFVKEIRTPNKPSEVIVEPIEEFGIGGPKRKLAHYTDHAEILTVLRGDRIYSFTDVTRNAISINPLMIDWTEYCRKVE